MHSYSMKKVCVIVNLELWSEGTLFPMVNDFLKSYGTSESKKSLLNNEVFWSFHARPGVEPEKMKYDFAQKPFGESKNILGIGNLSQSTAMK